MTVTHAAKRRLFLLTCAIGCTLSACTPIAPYRTDVQALSVRSAPVQCSNIAEPVARDRAGMSNHERTPAYDLYFVEFDELGLLYPSDLAGAGSASRQIDALMQDLEDLAASCDGLSIVVYVHGWKHNASADDGNVASFQQLLLDAALVEQAKKDQFGLPTHRVVGVYTSWRGDSLDLPEPLKSLSFWDRKGTAQRVAEGESRTLFSRLRGFEARQNAATTSLPEKKVFTILMGHSFGGLILFNAISGALINYLYDGPPDFSAPDVIPRFGDMVILANPAVEATRYTPLHRAVISRHKFTHYQPPVFVSVTSTADVATRNAFPMGQRLGTLFDTKLSAEEREANAVTLGHMKDYITHELAMRPDDEDTCPSWIPVTDPSTDAAVAQEKLNLDLERQNSRRFFGSDPDHLLLQPGWTRGFCGNSVLKHVGPDPYSPVWNVRTTGDIIPDHSTITRPVFVNFVRQLYHDAIIYPLIVEQSKGTGRLK